LSYRDSEAAYQVVYVGTGRKMGGLFGKRPAESEHDWRIRLAEEQGKTCNDMAERGFRLQKVQAVYSAADLKGSWTEGVWLYFHRIEESG
jgi:hypothetical protein